MKNKSFRGNSAHFLALRKRLDIMGYSDLPLGLDSAPLAQQMLEDLVSTTENLKECDDIINGLKEKLEIVETQIEPLQSENTQLTRDCNQLHKTLIISSEETMRLRNQHASTTFELQSENRRLALMNKQASQHVRDLSNNLEALKNRLQQSVAMPSVIKISEVMEVDPKKLRRGKSAASSRATSVMSSESSFQPPSLSFNPSIFTAEIDNLRKERDSVKKEAEFAMTRMNDLENSMKLRESEIARLGDELQKQTGRDGYLVTLRHKCELQQQELDKLQTQVKAMNPTMKISRKNKKIKLVLTRPRTMVSIDDDVFRVSATSSSKNINLIENGSTSNEEENLERPSSRSSRSSKSSMSNSSVTKGKNSLTPSKHNFQQLILQKEEIEKQRQIQNQLKGKFDVLESQTQDVIKSKDKEIEIITEKNSELIQQLNIKDQTIAKMAADFAFVNDNLFPILNEKDLIIEGFQKIKSNPSNKNDILQIQQQFEKIKASYEEELFSKDELIKQLQSTQIKALPRKCANCVKLEQKLEDLQKQRPTNNKSDEQLQKLRAKVAQYEAQSQLDPNNSEKDKKINELLDTISKLQKELKDTQASLEECEQKCFNFPDAEVRLRATVEQLRSDKVFNTKEIKQKTTEIKNLKERLTETQRINKELQNQLSKAREESASCKQESEVYRSKTEEITKKANEKNCLVIKDANAAVQHVQKQLNDKANECEMYQKLLAEARRQLMPLTESTIPQYQAQISKMQREKEEIIKKVKRVAQLATYADRADQASFSSAVRQLQNEVRLLGL